MLFISRLKRAYSCFSSHFCFLVIVILLSIVLSVSFLMAVIRPPSYFSMKFSSRINESTQSSMLASFLPLSFLYIYSVSTSSLGCNALCMVISVLVLWFICLSSSLVHFRKGPKYQTRSTAQVFIPLISFLLDCYLILLKYSFLIFSFICTCLMVSTSKMPKYLLVSFYPKVLILSWLGNSIPSVRCRLSLFITSMAHFSMPNSFPMSWLYSNCVY